MTSKAPPMWGELARLQERLNHLFEQAFLGAGEDVRPEVGAGAWRPAIDLVEADDGYVLFVELAGVERHEIELVTQGGWLELSGERRMRDGEPSFLRLERRYGPFRRRIELSEGIDSEGITARLRRGVLEVRIPKRRPAPPGGSK